jgi:hypothetical protein
VRGELAAVIGRPGPEWVLGGVAAGAAGIFVCGAAGRLKELDLDAGGGRGEFSLAKGILLSLLAGILSAVYGFALEVAAPVAGIAERHGAGVWKGNVLYLFANTGAFVTAALYALHLARKNRSLGELRQLAPGGEPGSLSANYLLALLTGTLWYGQFFFYNLGHVHLGSRYAFSSWAIHMILLVLFSNLVAMLFREWKTCRGRTLAALGAGLTVLCAAVLMLTYGNYLALAGSAAVTAVPALDGATRGGRGRSPDQAPETQPAACAEPRPVLAGIDAATRGGRGRSPEQAPKTRPVACAEPRPVLAGIDAATTAAVAAQNSQLNPATARRISTGP